MKDARVTIFQKTLAGLIESLDATVRVQRWTGAESVPVPLKESASLLVERIGTAGRLVSGNFRGSPVDVARVNAMLDAMRRLDAAYVAYRQGMDRPAAERERAEMALGAVIDEVRADSQSGGSTPLFK